jgi:hypothetical protein
MFEQLSGQKMEGGQATMLEFKVRARLSQMNCYLKVLQIYQTYLIIYIAQLNNLIKQAMVCAWHCPHWERHHRSLASLRIGCG